MRDSKIEWCHHTFNPWMGCAKVSDGCKHCYAEELMDNRYGRVKWGVHGTRQRTSAAYWKQPLLWNRKTRESGTRQRVFCASLADVMEDRAELHPIREDLFKLIEATPNLDWLLLSKRPENFTWFLPKHWLLSPLPTVWLGTSVEDQSAADKRIPHLLNTPAVIRFISAEPLLGELNLSPYLYTKHIDSGGYSACDQLDWVIVGGESGRGARPMHPKLVRSLCDQCVRAGVSFFFKQWGEWGYHQTAKWTDSMDPFLVGKAKAGRLLDGQEWNQIPTQTKIN